MELARRLDVPSVLHEFLIEVFRNRPRLVCELLELCAGLRLEAVTVEPGPTEGNQLAPTEFRADAVFILRDDHGAATWSVIVESQLAPDPAKRSSWPVYVVTARARLACPATLLVIVRDRNVARWARQPIDTGHPGFVLAPIVICLEDLPPFTDLPAHQQTAELALLCALGTPDLATAEAAVAHIHHLDEDRAKLYLDVLLNHLPSFIRQILETQMMKGYEYQSDFARKYYGQGLDVGRELGLQQAILVLAATRLSAVPAALEDKLRGITDVGALERVIAALGQARDEAATLAALEAVVGPLT
jgi:hypothetical protein